MFQCFNVASIGPAISFRSFDVSHKRRWGGYIINLTLNCCSISLFFVATESDSLYLSGPCFNVSMWPVLVLQFHFEVLMFHTGGDGECIIISTPNSCSILVFFGATEIDILYLSGPCFNVSMWPVLVLQFHFEVLMFQQEEMERVYHYFNIQFLLNFSVLCCY